jgi:hypothetical protein
MFGDPLHFLVIAASGSALAWDAKFLIAKWLLAMGLGVLALRVSGHLRSALIIAASAAFFGFFSFRINHPAFFSFCYAPWILVAWLRLTASSTTRDRWINSGWLLLANWTVLNSGTAKEAYMLLLSLNATGTLVVLMDAAAWRDRLRAIAFAVGACATLILLSAPIWLTFLDALRASFTTYNAPTAWQIHPAFLLGLFDEIFYRPLQPGERVSNPSANFIILGGLLYLAASWRARPPGPLANALAIDPSNAETRRQLLAALGNVTRQLELSAEAVGICDDSVRAPEYLRAISAEMRAMRSGSGSTRMRASVATCTARNSAQARPSSTRNDERGSLAMRRSFLPRVPA